MDKGPRLANIECANAEHPEGNRFMEHVGTRRQQTPDSGPDAATEHIAMFRCVKCHRVTSQPFDPEAPSAE